MRARSRSYTSSPNNLISLLTTQPSVLVNRFIINLKSLGTAGSSYSSQGSSSRQWSRFSAPNFRIPASFLGNISEDLQDGHELAGADYDSYQEADAASLSIQGSPEAELEETSAVAHSSSSPCPVNAQVSFQVYSTSKPREGAPLH